MRRSATRAGLIVLLALATCAVSYAQSDSIVWQYRYSGPGNSDDQPLASFVDDTGNVYVVGWTERDSTGLDVLVLKLDSLGSQIWVRTYDYGRRKNDVAMDAARDPSGNVYISASVVDANGDRLCLLKYNPSFSIGLKYCGKVIVLLCNKS